MAAAIKPDAIEHPLQLSAGVGRWAAFAARKAAAPYAALSKKVFERDSYACHFCGFQAYDYQEVINLDQDYQNNRLSNCVTACLFCTQCLMLDGLSSGFGGGYIIHLPEISQVDLNSLCHVLFCALVNETDYKPTAQDIIRDLRFRAGAIETHFGEGCSDPAVFGQLLVDYQENNPNVKALDTWMSELRLLPSRIKFKKQIEHWASAALEDMPEATG